MDNKYQQIALHIRNEIIAICAEGSQLPGVRELSTRFAVTTITIRKAINVLISDGLIETRGTKGTYVTEKAAHGGICLNFGLLAYDLFSLEHPYFNRICRGFSSYLEEHDAGSVQFLTIPSEPRWRLAGINRIHDMINRGIINGLAVMIPLSPAELRMLWQTGIPLVNVNRRYREDYPFVMENAVIASELLHCAAEEKKITEPAILGAVKIDEAGKTGTDVVQLLLRRYADRGGEPDKLHVFRLPTEATPPDAGYKALEAIFEKYPRTDGVVAIGDSMIRDAAKFINEKRPGMPFVVYSDEYPVENASVVALPLRQIGRCSAEILLNQISSGERSAASNMLELEPYQLIK